MFEVSGNDIQKLDDTQLRTLVARLAIAELRSMEKPVSGVTAGGDQNAPDGGLDVRVEVPIEGFSGDFIPRVPVGFQVKKPDMGPAAIAMEMKPTGVLRSVIGDLADAGGAYIIVSSRGSVADQPLRDRRAAIKSALGGHQNASKLFVDFYDRGRLSDWVNCFPGVAAWVRARIGRPLAGWQSLGDWSGTRIGGDGRFIFDDTACLLDARSKDQAVLPMLEGVQTLRTTLSGEGQCVRLIGMSGLGKTRLVQALFESEVGTDSLDPSLAVYADYSETPNPTAKQLALSLVATGQRAILVIDNCNPQTHSDLAKICSSSQSKISLITVEYDVGDDGPERTDVFRLQSASNETLVEWLKVTFPHVTQVDRDRIAEFSGGNFRVAGVLADTVKHGDSLGHLRDRDLFARIFQQRNNSSDELLCAAEALALVYSFEGTDTSSSSELSAISVLAGVETEKLYGFVAELRRRAVVQARGQWRALLPHAIANRLAAQALERIPPDQFDRFCAEASPRMQKSITRRLGYLHDNSEAIATVKRWLALDGPLGDLLSGIDHSLQLLRNMAPVAPLAVLERLEDALESGNGATILDARHSGRWQLTAILKSLAYDPDLFDRATIALARFLAAEHPEENHNSAKGAFEELFQLHLSGTQASPEQRRRLVDNLYHRSDFNGVRCGDIALKALLQSSMFSSTSNFDFGARPRDFGWQPPTYGDAWNWFSDAIDLAVQLSSDEERRFAIRRIVGSSLRGILGIEACLTSIEAATTEFLEDGEWIGGWLTVRSAIRYEKDSWSPEVRERVAEIESRLRPTDPINVARAYVIEARGAGYSLIDGEDESPSVAYNRLNSKAEELGREFATQPELLAKFLPEIMQDDRASRAFAFGTGLADSTANHLATWDLLETVLAGLPGNNRSARVMGGFLSKLNGENMDLAAKFLDASLSNPEILQHFVYLQANVGLDEVGIARLRQGIAGNLLDAQSFNALVYGVVGSAPKQALIELLDDLSGMEGGTVVALEILHMTLYCHKDDGIETDGSLLDLGHRLLLRTDFSSGGDTREYRVQQMIKECYAGPRGEAGAEEICRHIVGLITERKAYAFQLDHVFEALFEVQPLVALNEFMFADTEEDYHPIYGHTTLNDQSPLERVDAEILWSWADTDPTVRYALLGRSLQLFSRERYGDDLGLSKLFVETLERSQNRNQFLANFNGRLAPSGWSGNLSAILERRHNFLAPMTEHSDDVIRSWATEQQANLKSWAARERVNETKREESFE